MGSLGGGLELPPQETEMAKKGGANNSASKVNDMSVVRAAKGKKGKRDLSQDRWKIQATLLLPVDGDVQPKDVKKFVEDAGGTIALKTRTVVRGYQTEDDDGNDDGADGQVPTVDEIEAVNPS